MRIWIITVGEPSPTDGPSERLYRSGILADLMARQGHQVIWWTSTFDHARRRQRFDENHTYAWRENLAIKFIYATGYKKSIGLARILCHVSTAKSFSLLARQEERPDVILVSYPTIELSNAAIEYGQRNRVPVAVDIRDLWPDLFTDVFPRFFKPVVRLLCMPMNVVARRVFFNATSVVGITPEFIQWGRRKGSRSLRPMDRAFAMGYERPADQSRVSEVARSFWTARGLSEEQWIICFFGTLGKQFALASVIKAAKLLEKRLPNVRFVICGDGDQAERYLTLAEGVKTVQFPGWIDREQINSLMVMAKVGLAPYRQTENFLLNLPNKPIEYLSAGLPVISTIPGVLGKLIEDHDVGVVSPQNDPQALASLIEDLYKAPQRLAAMSKNAQALYDERFDANHVYREFSDYLVDLANSSREEGQAIL